MSSLLSAFVFLTIVNSAVDPPLTGVLEPTVSVTAEKLHRVSNKTTMVKEMKEGNFCE